MAWRVRGPLAVALGGLLLAVAAAPSLAAPGNPDLVVNGGFEQPALSGTNVEYYGPGLAAYGVGISWPIPNLTIPGWTVASGSVDVNTTGTWQAADGVQSVDLSGVGPGTIYQDLATTPGESYDVAFALSGNPFCGAQNEEVAVDWAGATVATPSFGTGVISNAQADMHYAAERYTVGATSTATRLQFRSLNSSSCGPVIDAVHVTNAYDDLCALARQDATKPGVADSLCAKLSAAEADALRGETQAKAGVLGAFAHEVSAQSGKALSGSAAAELVERAAQL